MMPMLAAKLNKDLLRFPVLVSRKLDGIRAIKREGKLWSRRAKLIPNRFVQEQCAHLPDGLDGELLLSDLTAPYRSVASAVMSRDGEPDFKFGVFDLALPELEFSPFQSRYLRIPKLVFGEPRCFVFHHKAIFDHEELEAYYAEALRGRAEGIIIRSVDGRYRRGRCSAISQEMLKLKLVDDEEAKVLELIEERESSNLLNPVGKQRIGAILCQFKDGVIFECGTGFTEDERIFFWTNPDLLVGQTVTITHQPAPGGRGSDKPRFPVFKGIRYD